MRLGILTYDTYHLKTEQLIEGLQIAGSYEYEFFALPFVQRPAREVAFAHRAVQSTGAHAREVAASVGAPYTCVETADDITASGIDYWVIAGSNLLPEGFVGRYRDRVINGHAGLIPSVRGLDSFKWAILEGQPIGNTLHFIDERADAGTVIAQKRTPLFSHDTLESFAARHYANEISMLATFERLLRDRPMTDLDLVERPARMRMKVETEVEMIAAFDGFKQKYATTS